MAEHIHFTTNSSLTKMLFVVTMIKMHLKIIEDGKAMGVLMCYLVQRRGEFFFCNASSKKDEMRYACAQE